MAEHAFSASENWPLGWEGGASACRGRPPAKNTKHNKSMKRVRSLANLVPVAPLVVQGVVHAAQKQAPAAMSVTLGRDPNRRRRAAVPVGTPTVLKRPVGRISRGTCETSRRHGHCSREGWKNLLGRAAGRGRRSTGCGEAPEGLEQSVAVQRAEKATDTKHIGREDVVLRGRVGGRLPRFSPMSSASSVENGPQCKPYR